MDKPRGKICELCSRKFVLNNKVMAETFGEISTKTQVIKQLQAKVDKAIGLISDVQTGNEAKLQKIRDKITKEDQECQNVETRIEAI